MKSLGTLGKSWKSICVGEWIHISIALAGEVRMYPAVLKAIFIAHPRMSC